MMTSESITNPDVGRPVGTIASTQAVRESLQLMMQMKSLLQEIGITISIAAPDAYTQLLSYSNGVESEEVQQLRYRLELLEPPHTCVYAFDAEDGVVSCGRCGSVLTLRIPATASESHPIRIACPNCQMPFAVARSTKE